MNKIIFLFPIFCALQGVKAWAEPVRKFSVEMRDTNKVLILNAPDCVSLKQQLKEIVSWKVARGEEVMLVEIDCQKTPNLRQYQIQNLVPAKVLELHNRRASCEGPNCWNAALYEVDVLSKLRFSGSNEFTHLLSTHCKLRSAKAGELTQSGDVAAIRQRDHDGKWTEVHGFISVGQLAFSKNDMGEGSPWLLRSVTDEFSIWGFGGEPECLSPDLGQIPLSCKRIVSFYHCDRRFDTDSSPVAELEQVVSDCATGRNLSSSPIDLSKLEEVTEVLSKIGRASPELLPTVQSLQNQYALSGAALHMRRVRARSSASPDLTIGPPELIDGDPFRSMVEAGDIERLQEFKERGGNLNRKILNASKNSLTALHIAVKRGDLRLVKWLRKNGADLSVKDSLGSTPIDYLGQVSDVEVRRGLALLLR